MEAVVEEGQADVEAGKASAEGEDGSLCIGGSVVLRAMWVTWWSRGELTSFHTMIRVMEGHEVYRPLQLKRIDWRQEVFTEGEESEREHEDGAEGGQYWDAVKGQKSAKATSSGQPMDVDEEVKEKAVDATKVMEERSRNPMARRRRRRRGLMNRRMNRVGR